MAKSFAQRLLDLMREVLDGTLTVLHDPSARASVGLNPDVMPDSCTMRDALDRAATYFVDDTPAQRYLETVDDIISARDLLPLERASAHAYSFSRTAAAAVHR